MEDGRFHRAPAYLAILQDRRALAGVRGSVWGNSSQLCPNILPGEFASAHPVRLWRILLVGILSIEAFAMTPALHSLRNQNAWRDIGDARLNIQAMGPRVYDGLTPFPHLGGRGVGKGGFNRE